MDRACAGDHGVRGYGHDHGGGCDGDVPPEESLCSCESPVESAVSTTARVPLMLCFVASSKRSVNSSNFNFANSVLSASGSTPALTKAPSTISPLIPEKQSKYAIFNLFSFWLANLNGAFASVLWTVLIHVGVTRFSREQRSSVPRVPELFPTKQNRCLRTNYSCLTHRATAAVNRRTTGVINCVSIGVSTPATRSLLDMSGPMFATLGFHRQSIRLR